MSKTGRPPGFQHSDETKKKMSRMSRSLRKDLTGKRINKLTVAWPVGRATEGRISRVYWLCFCDCGNMKVYEGRALRRKGARSRISCGCARRNVNSAAVNLYAQYRHKAKERGYEWKLTLEEFQALITSPCYYTGRSPQQLFIPPGKNPSPSIMWNGIDRLDNSKGYTPDNCVPAWGVVNKMKLTMSKDEFISICKEVAKTHNIKEPTCEQ